MEKERVKVYRGKSGSRVTNLQKRPVGATFVIVLTLSKVTVLIKIKII